MYKIVPVTTEAVANKITCFKIDGFKESPVVPQGVLPNVTLYKVCVCAQVILTHLRGPLYFLQSNLQSIFALHMIFTQRRMATAT